MYFKPRIFISSTLKENLTIRNDIEEHFRMCGAEPLLYEKNLTPSTSKYTYRTDILESDFVIFIIKDEYGTKTDSGISGTHEELKIAFDAGIPNHTYIKLRDPGTDSSSVPSEELKELIDQNHISYYYFSDDKELFRRIKETTFTIAKESALRNIINKVIDKKTSASIAVNYDYEQAIGTIKIIETILTLASKFDINETSLFMALEPLFDWIGANKWIFIDKELQDMIEGLRSIWVSYAEKHANDYCINHKLGTIIVPIWGKITIYSYTRFPHYSGTDYVEYINNFVSKFEKMSNYVQAMKFDLDKQNF